MSLESRPSLDQNPEVGSVPQPLSTSEATTNSGTEQVHPGELRIRISDMDTTISNTLRNRGRSVHSSPGRTTATFQDGEDTLTVRRVQVPPDAGVRTTRLVGTWTQVEKRTSQGELMVAEWVNPYPTTPSTQIRPVVTYRESYAGWPPTLGQKSEKPPSPNSHAGVTHAEKLVGELGGLNGQVVYRKPM